MTIQSQLDTAAAEKAAAKRTDTPTVVEELTANFLRASHHHIRKSFDPATPKDDFTTHCGFAHAYALVAYLLDAHQQTGDDTTELAWELHEFAQNGEPLADWVNEQVHARGIKTDDAS